MANSCSRATVGCALPASTVALEHKDHEILARKKRSPGFLATQVTHYICLAPFSAACCFRRLGPRLPWQNPRPTLRAQTTLCSISGIGPSWARVNNNQYIHHYRSSTYVASRDLRSRCLPTVPLPQNSRANEDTIIPGPNEKHQTTTTAKCKCGLSWPSGVWHALRLYSFSSFVKPALPCPSSFKKPP